MSGPGPSRTAFEHAGWTMAPGLVPVELCDQVRADLARYFDVAQPPGRLLNAWEVSRPVRALATHPRVIGLVSHLLGERAIAFQTLDFARGTEQAPHVDSLFFDTLPRGQMCGVWVALEPASIEAGPLRLWPGSHRVPSPWPALDGSRQDDGDFASRFEPFVDVVADQGDAIVWAANLMHGGAAVVDPASTRWSQVTHYFAADRIYISPIGSDVESGRYLVRDQLVDIGTGRRAHQRSNTKSVWFAHEGLGRSRLVVDPSVSESIGLVVRDAAMGGPSVRRWAAAHARRGLRRVRRRPQAS